MKKLTIVEPFYGGSHAFLADFLAKKYSEQNVETFLITLPAKKWHWRMLVSSTKLANRIPTFENDVGNTLFVTAMTNLAELLGLNKDIRKIYSNIVLYFHENQLNYPKSEKDNTKEAFNLCYNQIISCVVADVIAFNSLYNKNTFFTKSKIFLNKIPKDSRPEIDFDKLEKKSNVLHIPIVVPDTFIIDAKESNVLHIVWPHRWEHDKNPDFLVDVLEKCNKKRIKLKISVLGDQDISASDSMRKAKEIIDKLEFIAVVRWGGFAMHEKEKYFEHLSQCDVALSTAGHEFYGIAMLEAASCGCDILAPNDLSYPELFAPRCLFTSASNLVQKIESLSLEKGVKKDDVLLKPVDWNSLKPDWDNVLGQLKSDSKRQRKN